jgi:hypothetical protein
VQHFAILQLVFPGIDSTGLFSEQNIIITMVDVKLGPYGARQPDPISRKNFPKYNNFKIYFFFVTLTKFFFLSCLVVLLLCAVCLLSFLGLDCYDEDLTKNSERISEGEGIQKKRVVQPMASNCHHYNTTIIIGSAKCPSVSSVPSTPTFISS